MVIVYVDALLYCGTRERLHKFEITYVNIKKIHVFQNISVYVRFGITLVEEEGIKLANEAHNHEVSEKLQIKIMQNQKNLNENSFQKAMPSHLEVILAAYKSAVPSRCNIPRTISWKTWS